MSVTTVSTRRFTKEFSSLRNKALRVTDRGEVVGEWKPVEKRQAPVNFLARQKACGFTKPLPFTGTELLKAGKKR
jgi:hypothetical protein